jgi:hypothetical protein
MIGACRQLDPISVDALRIHSWDCDPSFYETGRLMRPCHLMAACIGRVHNRVYLLLVRIFQREEVNSLYMLTSELLTVHFPVEHCVFISSCVSHRT